MHRALGLAGTLAASVCLSALAVAQDTTTTTTTSTTTTGTHMVTTPVIVTQGGTAVRQLPEGGVVTQPSALVMETATAEAAPFRPAPIGTIIETTADTRLVRTVNGYDVTYDIGNRRDTTHALLTDGFGATQIY